MKVEKLNYTLNTNNKQQITKQKGFGNNTQTQMELPKQSWETSGSVGITDKKMSVPLRNVYFSGKMSKASKTPYAVISFGGNNKNQQIVITAEMKPYAAKGGVATVVDDYKNMFDEGKDNQKVMIMPYYNGRRQLEEKNDVKTSKWNGDVKVNKFPQGTKDAKGNDISDRFYFTNVKLSETSVDKIIKDNKYKLLEEVALDKIEMGDKEYDIGLYRVEGTNHYMVNTLPTARMREAYETKIGGYSSDGGENIPDVFEADDYAVFCKATVKLLPQIKEYYEFGDKDNQTKITGKQAFDPYAILCNDAQTAYIPHYVSQEHENNNEYFKTMNINYVVHNAGEGYIGRTSLKKMAVNLGMTKEQVDKIKNSQEYKDAKELDVKEQTDKNEEKFWKEQVFGEDNAKKLSDDKGFPNALSVAMSYTNNGSISQMYTVAEVYADSFKNEKNAIPHLQQSFVALGEKFIGNLNGLDNEGKLDPTKRVTQEGYAYNVYKYVNDGKDEYYTAKEVAQRLTDKAKAKAKEEGKDEKSVTTITPEEVETKTPEGYELTARKFEVFDESVKKMASDEDYAKFKTIQARNRLNLFKRFVDFGNPDEYANNARDRLVTGIINKPSKMHGGLDLSKITGLPEDTFKNKSFDELVKDDNIIQKMKDLHVTVSWGRGDLQKGIDNVISSWMKEAERDDKAVLIVGAEFVKDSDETPIVKKQIEEANRKFAGRFVYLDSFAPANPLSIIGDIALFPSRFAPCELTDLEAMKYGACPVVTNIQGLKQKNFDPELDAALFNNLEFKDQIQQTSYRTVHNYNLATPEQLKEYDVAMNKAIEFLDAKCKELKIGDKNIIEGSKDNGFKYNAQFKNENLNNIMLGRDTILEKFDKEYQSNTSNLDEAAKAKEKQEIREILRGSLEFVDSGYTKEEKKLHDKEENDFKNTYDVKTLNEEQSMLVEKRFEEGQKKLVRTAIDKIITNELSLASIRQICGTKETKRKISVYNMNLNTTMKGNSFLHKVASGKGSTEEIYKDGLKNKQNTLKALYTKDMTENCSKLKEINGGNESGNNVIETIKNWWKNLSSAGKWGVGIGAGVATAAAIGGGVYAGIKANQKKTALAMEASQNISADENIDNENIELIENT